MAERTTFNFPSFYCPSCNAPGTIPSSWLRDYFSSASTCCKKCKSPLRWWDVALEHIKTNFMGVQPFTFVDAQHCIFTFKLHPAKSLHIDFCDYGVPKTATILAVNYTPSGSLTPLQLHSQQLIGGKSTWKYEPHKVILYPLPFTDRQPTETDISCLVTWVDTTRATPVFANLVTAFSAYAGRAFSDSIVPANIAVESELSLFLASFLGRYASKKRVEEFLNDGATYGHQLNVLLPVLAQLISAPELPDHIRGSLNRLRQLRNDLAHRGALPFELAADDVAELLTGAIFGVGYVRMLTDIAAIQTDGTA